MEFERRADTGAALFSLINELHIRRREIKASSKKVAKPRVALTKAQRAQVLAKTDRRCHICGGTITEANWHADHVFPRSSGGTHTVDNYLPAHAVCNNYRWDYTPEEYQLILKLGVWLKGEILQKTSIGNAAAEKFVRKQKSVFNRRRLASPTRDDV